MTTIQFSLPDDLAQLALERGLLSPQVIEQLLRDELHRRACAALRATLDQIDAAGIAPMSEEEINEEIREVRKLRAARA